MKKPKVISLFSGCGGLDLGFLQLGFDIIWANDILKDACESYKLNIGNHIVNEDITNINLDHLPKADLIIGGPPCQGFSGIGKRDPNDKRSDLVYTYLSIVKKVQPTIFLFENVTGLKSSKMKPSDTSMITQPSLFESIEDVTINYANQKNESNGVLENLKKSFNQIGYRINIYTLNAADYGVPQRRKRVFIIGNRLTIDIAPPYPTHYENSKLGKKWVSSFEAISDLQSPNMNGIVGYKYNPTNDFQRIMRSENLTTTTLHFTPYSSNKDREIMACVKPGGNYMDVPDEIATKRIKYFKKTGGRTTTYGRLDPEKPNYTLNTHFNRPNIGCNIHYEEDRLITIREGLRFQSFPDHFDLISSNKRNFYVQVGNAVPPLLSQAWANRLIQYF